MFFLQLSELSARAAGKRQELSASTGGSRLKVDLGVLNKWKISDATTFGQTLLQFEENLVELKNIRETFKQAVRELNGNMLKGVLFQEFFTMSYVNLSTANTRREEIARFDKAKTDKEFAKMLSTRSLGPEHVEAQQQLRRSIRVRLNMYAPSLFSLQPARLYEIVSKNWSLIFRSLRRNYLRQLQADRLSGWLNFSLDYCLEAHESRPGPPLSMLSTGRTVTLTSQSNNKLTRLRN